MVSPPIKVKMCIVPSTGPMARSAPLEIGLVVCLANEKCVPMSHDDDKEHLKKIWPSVTLG